MLFRSGASLIIRKSFWDRVQGFDVRYTPAYCEDSDLAMTARDHGMRVIYCPASEVIHFEHQSYAEDRNADHWELMRRNQQLLVDKWRVRLEQQHLPAGSNWALVAANGERSTPERAAARRKQGKFNILYFSPFPSHPDNHGNQATIQKFGRRFQSLGHKVHFALLKHCMFSAEIGRAHV